MTKKKIALIMGGYTGEAVVSEKSAAIVAQHLDRDRYEVHKVHIYPGNWYLEDEKGEKYPVDLNGFTVMKNGQELAFDGIFNIIHGTPGEDGKLAGYFDMLDIPYTTCDALTSSITMNKGYTKAILSGIDDLYMARSMQLFSNLPDNVPMVLDQLRLPYFVKPNNGGSSIGMSKVKKEEELEEALKRAFKEDKQVLVEEFVTGREFSIGIYKTSGQVTVLPATEIISSREFFDFEAKYIPGVSEEITPGRMDEREVERVKQIAEKVYLKLNCKGSVRMDYFLEKDTGKFYFIEINTVPGQTETSLISQQVRAMGMSLKDFYTDLIEEMWR
ncbi:D-alanine--D-alanine ligase [Cyclobacterium plantarum]|uniref:D-alanine--D-alanine ligase n=1 Tax=Cyclobacterium plantarum TaxID=2716263 RepID=A0ABX0H7K1_9BACT|nr:D-alanine--D-alanine ligase [Cyclobacterium plantarum]NHE56873.1 D-alanine--D-alanine ligase [Cyclobacterium plantarum]